MREICTSGSEGGVAQTNAPFLPPIKVLRTWLCLLLVGLGWMGPGQAAVTARILAWDETGLPVDTPSAHLDKAGRGQYFHGRLGGRFGDTGGGVVLAPYLDWIYTTTNIPEPGPTMLMLIVSFCMCLRSRADSGLKTA